MNYYIDSKRYTNNEKSAYLSKNIFIYDLRGYDGSEEHINGFIATIEPSVLTNHVGSILTKSNIFEVEEHICILGLKIIDFDFFEQKHKEVFDIKDL